MGIYRIKIDKTVILHINGHLSVHTSFIKNCVCARAMTFGLCCFGTVFRLQRYKNLVYVHFNLFIDLTINSHTNPCNLASSRLLWVRLPCDKSHPREIRETGKDWFGKLSVPSLSRKFSSYTPLYAWRLCRLLFIVYKVNHFFSFVFNKIKLMHDSL